MNLIPSFLLFLLKLIYIYKYRTGRSGYLPGVYLLPLVPAQWPVSVPGVLRSLGYVQQEFTGPGIAFLQARYFLI